MNTALELSALPAFRVAPARHNPRLQALIERINADEELRQLWRCANVNAMDRLGLNLAAAAIGGTVALEALFAGPISGASMNPARSLAPALVSGQHESVWIYLLAPLLGGLLGSTLYRWLGWAVPETSV